MVNGTGRLNSQSNEDESDLSVRGYVPLWLREWVMENWHRTPEEMVMPQAARYMSPKIEQVDDEFLLQLVRITLAKGDAKWRMLKPILYSTWLGLGIPDWTLPEEDGPPPLTLDVAIHHCRKGRHCWKPVRTKSGLVGATVNTFEFLCSVCTKRSETVKLRQAFRRFYHRPTKKWLRNLTATLFRWLNR